MSSHVLLASWHVSAVPGSRAEMSTRQSESSSRADAHAAVVHDALQMGKYCDGTDAARPDERTLPRGPFPPRKVTPPLAEGVPETVPPND